MVLAAMVWNVIWYCSLRWASSTNLSKWPVRHQWNLTGTEKLTCSYRNLQMCHTVHHKFHVTTLVLKLGLHVKLVGDMAWPVTTSLICQGSERQSLNKKKQFSSKYLHTWKYLLITAFSMLIKHYVTMYGGKQIQLNILTSWSQEQTREPRQCNECGDCATGLSTK
jgi:hypothetical protein